MKKWVVIVAAGSGERMKSDIPKQFLPLCDKPVLMHTLEAFHEFDKEMSIILVLPGKQIGKWEQLCAEHHFHIPLTIAEGGSSRFLSVRSGMACVGGEGLVAVHDGVRCLTGRKLMLRCFHAAHRYGSAVPVISLVDSLREISGKGNKQADRNRFVAVQTPQCFHAEMLKKAVDQALTNTFPDEASCIEQAGITPHLIDGDPYNFKITTSTDLLIAEAILKIKSHSSRLNS